MHKSIFHSDTLCPILAGMICICCLLSGCRMQARTEMFPSKEGYLITIGEDPTDRDTRWAKYLYEHLKKRANDDEMVAFGVSEMDMWRIIIQIDPTLQREFKVACKGSDIRLTASDDKQMLWLQYQLIKKISKEDPRIDGSDLPPALINLNDTCGAFAFDYQSIYSPYGLNADHTGVIGLNNFDDSWGIWGHNLRKVLGKDAEKVYATIHGKTDDSQLCFSSEDMYRQIENYIVDNFGEKGNFRFVIAPDDTPYACTCTTCTALGNTEKNATPAVTELILRLSQRFPKHTFFTTSYLTTQQVTDKQLPVQRRGNCQRYQLPAPPDRWQGRARQEICGTTRQLEKSNEQHLYMGLYQQLRRLPHSFPHIKDSPAKTPTFQTTRSQRHILQRKRLQLFFLR